MIAQAVDTEPDHIEGLGDDRQPALWPADSINSLLIRNENRTVHEVLRRIRADRYVMNPDLQRDFIWDDEKQSKLIESVIMRIPLPVLYLAEDDEGRMIVVDGLQRLSTFKGFFDDKLKLKLKDRPELDGKRFRDLPPKLQNRIEDCNLILYIIDSQVPERARLDIFERVNGGVALTRQQMRNCLFMGKATRFLRDEAKTELFLDATGRSLNSKTMRDRLGPDQVLIHFFRPRSDDGAQVYSPTLDAAGSIKSPQLRIISRGPFERLSRCTSSMLGPR